VGQKK